MISLSQPSSGNGNGTFTGGGTLATGGYTLTVPATGTAALLGTANVFTALQTVTLGSANVGVLTSTGYSLTGSNATSMIDLAGTWNTSGSPTAIKLNLAITACGSSSNLLDLKVGGSTYFSVNYIGQVIMGNALSSRSNTNLEITNHGASNRVLIGSQGLTANGISIYNNEVILASNGYFGFSSTTNSWGTGDIFLARKAAATLQMGKDAAGVTNQMFTAASRITSDGVGANLTIAGGNGRGGAGGSLIFSTYSTNGAGVIGTLTSRMTIDTDGYTEIKPNGTDVVLGASATSLNLFGNTLVLTASTVTVLDGADIVFDVSTGSRIGSATGEKIGFWGATPVVQQVLATGGGAAVDDVITFLQTIGLCKQS